MTRNPTPTGRRIRCPEGYTAFVPDPLLPNVAWTPRLVRALSDADRAVGELAGGEGGVGFSPPFHEEPK